jgi:hypothetical protein
VDRDNGALLNDIGRVDPVTPTNGSNNPGPLFFDRQLTPSDISLIRKDDIRFIVTDTRLTEGLPLYGAYIAPGETRNSTLLTAAELEKFNSAPWVRRIYDNGAIQVYDLSALMGKYPLAVPRGSLGTGGVPGTDVAVLVLASLVVVVWLIRLRRRARLVPIDEHMVVCGMVGAMAVGLFGAFTILFARLPPGPIALLTLLVLLALGLRPVWWRMRPPSNIQRWAATPPVPLESTAEPHMASVATHVTRSAVTSSSPVMASTGQPPRRAHRARSQLALGCAGLALFAVGASMATATARQEWVPPPELSIDFGQADKPVASVDLGVAAPIAAQLAVVTGGRVLWSTPLSPNSATHNIVLPADLLHSGSHLLLVAGGKTIRYVDG